MQAIKKLRENSQFFCFQLGHAPLGLRVQAPFGAVGIGIGTGTWAVLSSIPEGACACGAEGHMASIGPPALGAKGCVERLNRFAQGAADWRSGPRWTIHPIGALPRTPFPAARDFAPVGSMSLDSRVAWLPYESSSFATSRGNERYEGKNSESYTSGTISAFSPFGGWRHHLARWESCHLIRGSRGSPMNPVSLSPPLRGGTIKLRGSIFS